MSGKRWFDLVLIALTAPVWTVGIGVLAATVWLVDGRPVFFTQPGWDGTVVCSGSGSCEP